MTETRQSGPSLKPRVLALHGPLLSARARPGPGIMRARARTRPEQVLTRARPGPAVKSPGPARARQKTALPGPARPARRAGPGLSEYSILYTGANRAAALSAKLRSAYGCPLAGAPNQAGAEGDLPRTAPRPKKGEALQWDRWYLLRDQDSDLALIYKAGPRDRVIAACSDWSTVRR
ncbi:hypothetical protein HPB47_007823 [Ixodes persulcatus]|uniref:Uncharacterized protein n=1 Tax=Ixodes persulcatus TaxID=34615 RepID=A0AC60P6E4_IXOPE|nr:hypothetical protein HPB47_007823 [Ixodes persulcatus]